MTRILGSEEAFGHPGIEPRWTQGNKDGVGTAYSADSTVWFTVWNGCITEVYYPTIDRPQIRDLQFLVTDGETFFHEEKRHLESRVARPLEHALLYRITNSDPEGRYSIVKEVICDPHLSSVVQRTWVEGDDDVLSRLRLFVLCAPHLQVGGWGNNACTVEAAGRKILAAHKGDVWLALAATVPCTRHSSGYVGLSDGWTDLADNLSMDWEFDRATDGNVALTGELTLSGTREFTLALAFGDGMHSAATTLLQSLGVPWEEHRRTYVNQWNRPCRDILPLAQSSGDGGDLYYGSYSLLLCHEDKRFPGALIASMSIPWGESKGDEEMGGYHLVWTRDMVNTTMGLLAAGDLKTPLRALIYLAATQHADGGFSQNFWIDGEPHWTGIQLDEVAFPMLLAWRLHGLDALGEFDPNPMLLRAAGFLIRNGPVTQQERWEEASGYSPSTLAASIAALTCAACLIRERGDDETAEFIQDYADFLEGHVEDWTVTDDGTLHPHIARHYIRIHPVAIDDPRPDENPNHGVLGIANRPPGSRREFPAKEIVDAGFLELVRYGIRKARDPLIEDSLRVVDEVLRVETSVGPCWRRYNHDGYGQRDGGGPYVGWGRGRAWPLLTGERGHYELAAGRDIGPFIRAMEGFASPTGLLPEQVWDEADRPDVHMYLGQPTGSAMPLMWAHSEYIQLLRSALDGEIFAGVRVVAGRYLASPRRFRLKEIWKPNRQVSSIREGAALRVQAPGAFRLHWSLDDWSTAQDTPCSSTRLGISYVDIAVPSGQRAPILFTFYWTDEDRWEGRDYAVAIEPSAADG